MVTDTLTDIRLSLLVLGQQIERQQIESENWDNRSKIKLFKLRIGQSDLSPHLSYSI